MRARPSGGPISCVYPSSSPRPCWQCWPPSPRHRPTPGMSRPNRIANRGRPVSSSTTTPRPTGPWRSSRRSRDRRDQGRSLRHGRRRDLVRLGTRHGAWHRDLEHATRVTRLSSPHPRPSSTGQSCEPARARDPRARFNGPCGDPFYRAVFDNRRSSVPVTFRWHFKSYKADAWVTRVRTVPAHTLVKTAWRQVVGRSHMTIRGGGQLLAQKDSAAPGYYRPCW